MDYVATKGIDIKQYNACAVVGGQATSEALRDKLIAGGFTRVISNYGASDLDIDLGIEDDFS